MGQTIEQRLREAWGGERRFFHLAGAAHFALWAVGLFLAALLIDWLFDLPGWLRLALLAACLAGLGYVAWRGWLRHLRGYDPTRVALQVERAHGGMDNLLVSWVQLGQDGAHGSARLIEAARQQAEQRAAGLEHRDVVDFSALRKPLVAAGSVVLLFALSGIWLGNVYLALLSRMLAPFSDAAYPTWTHIDAVSGDQVVKEGEPVEVSAEASGEVPGRGTVRLQFSDGAWEDVEVGGGGRDGGTFRYHVGRATQSFRYRFLIGDARSKPREVTVVHPPRIVSARVELRYPPYTGREGEEHKAPQLPVLPEGTEVRWEVRCDQPLTRAQLQVLREGEKPQAMEVDADDPHVCRLTVKDVGALAPARGGLASRTARVVPYRFVWALEKKGRQFEFEDAARYALDVMPDQAPRLRIIKPRLALEDERILITRKKVLALVFEATDDYGLEKAWVSYRLNAEAKPRWHAIGSFPRGSRNDVLFKADWSVPRSLPGVKEGDLLTCEVVASDNRQSKAGPNYGRSRPVRLQVVSEAEYQRYVERETARGLDRTKAAAREEIESGKRVKALIAP